MTSREIKAHYLIETAFPIEKAAEIMAGEQSSGTFIKIPMETQHLKENHGAHVENIEKLGTVSHPTLSGTKYSPESKIQRAIVSLSWPIANVGTNLSNLMATVAGNIFELKAFSGLKLLDIDLPEAFSEKYPGPKHGIEGTRQLAGVSDRPIIGTIIKPSVGLTPEQTAVQTKTLIEAGLDFLKDDELASFFI